MDLKIKNTQTFTARNKTIRFADDIARKVNKEIPLVSNTLMAGMKNSSQSKFNDTLINISALVGAVRYAQISYYSSALNFNQKIQAVINPIVRYGTGNCAESSQLATITAKANGIKNAQMRHLIDNKGHFLDHVVTYVPDKKPYIIDAWLGFADYVPNAIARYKNEFQNYIHFDNSPNTKIMCVEFNSKNKINNFINQDFTTEDTKTVTELYPELIMPSKNNFS